MTVSYVEREQATPETLAFYDKAEERFEMLLNIFKVFGHTPELGEVFTDSVMAMLKDGEIDWVTNITEARRRAAAEDKPLIIFTAADGSPLSRT